MGRHRLGADMTWEALRFENLTLGYDRHPATHHLDFGVPRGAMMAVAGPNGAGKSTLFKGIIGALKPMGGAIRLIGSSQDEIAYLPQRAELDWSFPMSVFDTVAMGLWREVGAFKPLGRNGTRRVNEALRRVGLAGLEGRPVGSLSGGPAQRALFARLLVQDAPLILLDEPFNAIDAATTKDLLELIRGWHGEGRTILAALHDFDLIHSAFPETLLLARELIAIGPTAEVVTPENLERARHLSESFHTSAPICERE